jgi:hypothetical protein
MTIIRVKGLKRYKDRHGKWRCYHRKTGTPIKAEFGTGDFFKELATLNAIVATKVEPKAGRLGGLIAAYKSGPRFQTRALRTRSDYQKVFDYLHPLADVPLTRCADLEAVVLTPEEMRKSSAGRKPLDSTPSETSPWLPRASRRCRPLSPDQRPHQSLAKVCERERDLEARPPQVEASKPV